MKYTDKDIQIIAELYSQCNTDKIFQLYPTLSQSSLYCLMSKNNVSYGNRWTQDDINIIINNLDKSDDVIYTLLTYKHSIESIRCKRNQLGYINRQFWTDEEILLLKQGYKESLQKACELLPNRTANAIYIMSRKLN